MLAPAQSFFIELSGGLILQDPTGLLGQPLLSITADVTLEIDPQRKLVLLTFNGQMNVVYLGTVGATSGFFELDLGATAKVGVPQLWGAATIDTNFDKLKPLGLDLYATGTLQINTTGQEHDEALTLPGVGPGGTTETDTYNLAPYSFSIDVAGKADVRVPTTNAVLWQIEGGFHIGLNPDDITIYAIGNTSYGLAQGLIVIQTGVKPGETPGIAAEFTISKGSGLSIPGIGSLFSITRHGHRRAEHDLPGGPLRDPAGLPAAAPRGRADDHRRLPGRPRPRRQL